MQALCFLLELLIFLPQLLVSEPTAARCYELMLERTFQRQTFGKYLYEHGSCRELIADSASDLEAARLLTLACAEDIDRLGARGARDKIALIKVTVPELTSRVVDRAVQVGIFMCWFTCTHWFSLMTALNPFFAANTSSLLFLLLESRSLEVQVSAEISPWQELWWGCDRSA